MDNGYQSRATKNGNGLSALQLVQQHDCFEEFDVRTRAIEGDDAGAG